MQLQIFKNLKDPVSLFVFIGTAFVIFDISYYVMANTLGTRNNMCVPGAGLTFWNVIFSLVISLLGGLIVSGLIALRANDTSGQKLIAGSSGGLGFFIGGLTVFCTLCTIPVITLFGLSVGLGFFTTYELLFKGIAIILMLIATYQLNKQFSGNCNCRV